MLEMLQNAGVWGLPLVAAALVSLLLGLGALGLGARGPAGFALTLAGVAVGVALLGLLGGRAGYLESVDATMRMVSHASPGDRELLRAASLREAGAAVSLGLFSVPGGLLGLIGGGLAFQRRGS